MWERTDCRCAFRKCACSSLLSAEVLEVDFGLRNGADAERRNPKAELRKVDAPLGDVRHQVGNTLKAVLESYRFQTFGEYNALLSTLNIEAKQIRGEYTGTPYTGIVYSVTDDTGKVVSPPFKSSRFGKRFGNEQLEKRMLMNLKALKDEKWAPSIQADIVRALRQADSRKRFVELLRQRRIDVVFRENERGRKFGFLCNYRIHFFLNNIRCFANRTLEKLGIFKGGDSYLPESEFLSYVLYSSFDRIPFAYVPAGNVFSAVWSFYIKRHKYLHYISGNIG